MKVYWLQSIFL